MSDDIAPISREEEVLAVAMELELAVAKHVQAKLLAAQDADEINGLGRTWQRVSRSLRQTVALKAKLTREREAPPEVPPPRPVSFYPDVQPLRAAQRARIDQVCAASRFRFEREGADWDEAIVTELLMELAEYDDFMDVSEDTLIDRVLEILGESKDPEAWRVPPPAAPEPGLEPGDPGFHDSA